MPGPVIVMAPSRNLEPDVLAIARQMLPPGFEVRLVPAKRLTPHVAGPTWQSWPRRFGNAYANITRVQRGEQPQWVVPELADLMIH